MQQQKWRGITVTPFCCIHARSKGHTQSYVKLSPVELSCIARRLDLAAEKLLGPLSTDLSPNWRHKQEEPSRAVAVAVPHLMFQAVQNIFGILPLACLAIYL